MRRTSSSSRMRSLNGTARWAADSAWTCEAPSGAFSLTNFDVGRDLSARPYRRQVDRTQSSPRASCPCRFTLAQASACAVESTWSSQRPAPSPRSGEGVAEGDGWGVESRIETMTVRGAACAIVLASRRRPTPHPPLRGTFPASRRRASARSRLRPSRPMPAAMAEGPGPPSATRGFEPRTPVPPAPSASSSSRPAPARSKSTWSSQRPAGNAVSSARYGRARAPPRARRRSRSRSRPFARGAA